MAVLDLRQHAAGEPLKPSYERGFVYSDGWVDDARLVTLCAVDAAERGATVLTRTTCLQATRHATGWQATLRDAGGTERQVSAITVSAASAPSPADPFDCATTTTVSPTAVFIPSRPSAGSIVHS